MRDEYELTPRELFMIEQERSENQLNREHAVAIKSLELNLAREDHSAEIKLKELQAKWTSWLQIPVLIIKLPLFVLLGLAYICSVFTRKEMPKRFWDLLS
jgi:hypothetical protein